MSMKSRLKYFDFKTKDLSDCGQVLEIEFSNAGLGWPGIILEKGSSPYFYPDNVYTPYFYFALGLEENLHWHAKTDNGMTALKTSPGEIWVNPPDSPFSHDISEPCYFLILAVEEEFLASCSLGVAGKNIQFLNNYNVQDETIKGILELFFIEAQAKGRNGYTYLKHLLSLLSTHYIQNYSNYKDLQSERATSSKFDKHQFHSVDVFIEKNIGSQITVDDMADLLHCSKFYFLREFKKLMGITPYQYLMNKRLKKAQTFLSSGNRDIASIAFELGFSDQSHFTRTFKKQFGVTPGQYQKQAYHPS